MTGWRTRIGPERLEQLPAATIAGALKVGAICPRGVERVTIAPPS
jgi:hypothetical protein